MSKYDFNIDLSENSSTGLILSKIRPGSTVLEFGCAIGRMTKYMQEKLHCQVYIVEIDKEAYEMAAKYAADGVCGDIMDMEWKDKFSDISFDYIIFADVLEHLNDPDIVIKESAQLLAQEGRIIFSIPNITHNDIILKAIDNHFDYTDIGLLDSTHVHFWGLENIGTFTEKNGLYIHNIDATYCETGYTEQYSGNLRNTPKILLNILNERLCGNVYQFIVTSGLQAYENVPEHFSDKNGLVSYIYFDYGQDFSEGNKISFRTNVSENGKYIIQYVINDTESVRRIRFDPVEFQGCIVQNISVRRDGKILPFISSEHIGIENGMLMKGTDPMILVENLTGSGPIVIDADITIPGEAYVDMVESVCFDECSKFDEGLKKAESEKAAVISQYTEMAKSLEDTVSKLSEDNVSLSERLNTLTAENEQVNSQLSLHIKKENELEKDLSLYKNEAEELKESLDLYQNEAVELKKIIENFQKSKKILEQEYAKLKSDTDMYIRIIDQKEQVTIRMEQELNHKEHQIEELNCRTAQANAELCRYRNRKVVRFVDKIAETLRKIKRLILQR